MPGHFASVTKYVLYRGYSSLHTIRSTYPIALPICKGTDRDTAIRKKEIDISRVANHTKLCGRYSDGVG